MDIFLEISRFFEQGGDVLYLIALTTFLMWTLILERFWYFLREHRSVVKSAMDQWESREERNSWSARAIRRGLVSEASAKITGSVPIILTCITLCPLLGLLGTVTGMIQVFDAMATQGGNARSMAAGVSAATIPTMSGMIASLSGIMGSTFIRRRVNQETELLDRHLTMDH